MANNFPNIRPTLNLDMVNGIYVDPRVTFTRAGTRTYFSRDMVKAEENLLTYSQEFDNAAWTKSSTSVTANSSVAPDGTTTADQLIETATTATHSMSSSGATMGTGVVSGNAYTYSIFVKKGTLGTAPSWIQIAFTASQFTSGYANFNLDTGAYGVTSNVTTSTPVNFGSGWWRIAITATATSGGTSNAVNVFFTNNNDALGRLPSYAGAITSDVLIWGAQLEQRSSVTAYTVTTTQTITNYQRLLKTAAANEWPREFDPVTGECLGRSVWEARTNLLLRSEDLSTTWTNEESSESVNVAIAPDGTLTADLLIPNTNNLSHWINQSVTTTAAVHTLSFFAKAGGYSVAQVLNSNSGTDFINFNLSTGLIGSSTSYTGTITSIGNGWYRCTATFTATAGLGGWARIGIVSASTSARAAAFAGNGYSGIYIWGAQLELGSFAATYIPTVAAQVTSVADSALITGTNFSQWYNQAEGAFVVEIIPVSATTTSAQMIIDVNDGTINNRTRLFRATTTTAVSLSVNTSGSAQVSAITSGTFTQGAAKKAAVSYKINDFSVVGSGSAAGTDTSGAVSVVDRLTIGAQYDNTGQLNSYIKRLTYYPQALTSANLQAVTA